MLGKMAGCRYVMNSEFLRLSTFRDFQVPPNVFISTLVSNGFYRSSVCGPHQVVCFSCEFLLDVRELENRSVIKVHSQYSPSCCFAQSCSDNAATPVIDEGGLGNKTVCSGTVQSDPGNKTVDQASPVTGNISSVNILNENTRAGRTEAQDVSSDRVPAVCSQHRASDLATDSVLDGIEGHYAVPSTTLSEIGSLEHVRTRRSGEPQRATREVGTQSQTSEGISPGYAGETGTLTQSTGVPVQAAGIGESSMLEGASSSSLTPSDLGIETKPPKFKNYVTIHQRTESYGNWTCVSQDKYSLAEAGFFYTGKSDCTCCFFCGVGLKSWQPQDDPWVEHARWSPTCPHVLSVKKENFVSAVQTLNRPSESSQILLCDVLNEMQKLPSQDCLSEGSEKEEVNKEDDDQNESNNERQQKMDELALENDALKDGRRCRVCMTHDVRVLFLPCAHLASCGQCAPALTVCPICRQAVKGSVQVLID